MGVAVYIGKPYVLLTYASQITHVQFSLPVYMDNAHAHSLQEPQEIKIGDPYHEPRHKEAID